MCKHVNRGRTIDRTVRHPVVLEGHPLNLFVCVKTIPEYYSTFLKEIFPRGNNKVLFISLYHDKCLLFMLELY